MPTVTVIIPTLNAAKWLPEQLTALHAQTVAVTEILLADSESDDDTLVIAAADPLCRVMPVRRANFDHGGTRDEVARACESEYLWFLTQDAIPADERCLEELLGAMAEPDVACAYGRQIALQDASRIEQLNRWENYPEQSLVHGKEDLGERQIRTFFLSNSCCLYKREIYLRCGGFQHGLPTNEDMLMAADFLRQGYRTAYCATARVWHTHRMTLLQWYRRSFDIGAFTELYSKRLGGVHTRDEGKRYALAIGKRLLREGRVLSFFHFGLICSARLLGDHDGHRFWTHSERSILRRTQNPAFWKRYIRDHGAAYKTNPRTKSSD